MTEKLDQAARSTAGLRRRLLGTLLPAAVGCALGYLYGERFGDPSLASPAGLPGLYATLGAVVGILATRVGSVLWMVLRDFAGWDD